MPRSFGHRRSSKVPAHVIAWRELRNRWFADSALEESGFELSVPLGWIRPVSRRLEARSRRIAHSHNPPERFWSDPQTQEVVLRVAQPACRARREYLQQRVFGIGRDL